jgi:hypothetical protein
MDPYELIADDWYEPIIEDWKVKLEALGFKDAKILFSGLGSQGDGACFEARVVKDWAKIIPKNVRDEMTTRVVTLKLEGEHESAWTWWYPVEEWDFGGRLKHSGHYCHENSMDFELDDGAHFPDNLTLLWAWLDEVCKDVRDEAKRLSREIYSELEDAYFKEYEWAEAEAKRLEKEQEEEEEEEEEESCSPTEAVTADAAAVCHPA